MLIGSDVGFYGIGILNFSAFLNVGVNEGNEGWNSVGCFFKDPLIDLILYQAGSGGYVIKVEASENGFYLTVDFIKPDVQLRIVGELL